MKNLKVLHAGALLTPGAGMLNQMEWEQQAAHKLSIPWETKMFCPKGWMPESKITHFALGVSAQELSGRWNKLLGWWKLRYEYTKWLVNVQRDYDVLILRYYVHDIFLWWFVLNRKTRVYFVHHTLEVPELASAGLIGRFRSVLESIIGGASIRNADGIIGVTHEIVEYQKKRSWDFSKSSHIYPNGVIFYEQTVPDKRGKTPELLFVATYFESWHGLDLLLASLKKHRSPLVLHLVGNLNEEDAAAARLDDRIVLHGSRSTAEIREIASRCHVGLSSFALYRKGMEEACTLKVREYLMMGLPVYASYSEVFPENYAFYYRGYPDVAVILQQVERWDSVKRQEIAESAKQYIDKVELLRRVYQFLSVPRN